MNPPIIYLVGMPGSGKTTLAREAAATVGWKQVDLDAVIEAQTGKSVSELFSKSEAAFRDAEEVALQSLSPTHPTFISCGGGVIERTSNREFLKRNRVVFLDCPLEVVWQRLKDDLQRPLIQAEDADQRHLKLAALFVRRRDWFSEVATCTLEVGKQGISHDAQQLAEIALKISEASEVENA